MDEFDINIIDLSDCRIWENNSNNTRSINCLDDFKSISTMILTKKTSEVIVLLPQNLTFRYYYNYGKFNKFNELKNILNDVMQSILNYLYFPFLELEINYENTRTKVDNIELCASFYFTDTADKVLLSSVKSNKITTIRQGDVVISTLSIKTYGQLFSFLREIKLISNREEIPVWIKDEKMFDDVQQLEIIEYNNNIIQDANNKILQAEKTLQKNERYKSILYTSGDELVEVVFEILEQMLGWDLSNFVDMKKEDFNYKFNGNTYIGEIKGINSNVKNANVSQLDNHVAEYKDEHEEDVGEIVSLLIINHQRNRPLSEREPVNDQQIKLALRNESLIVETNSLLRLFEKYVNQEISRDDCLSILTIQKGLLKI